MNPQEIDISNIPDLQKDFLVSSAAFPAAGIMEKMDEVGVLESVLNNNLCLANYGTGVKHIWFAVLCEDLNGEDTGEQITFNSEEKRIMMALALHEPTVLKATFEEIPLLTAITFMTGISLNLKQLEEIPNFNLAAFRIDVRKLFAANGWRGRLLKEEYKAEMKWRFS